LRKEVDGAHVVIGFYKYVGNISLSLIPPKLKSHVDSFSADPDGKEQQIYYKADKKGYQVSYDSKSMNRCNFRGAEITFRVISEPFELPNESERLTDLSKTYLPPSANLIADVLSANVNNEYLPPSAPSRSYLPPN
jgi:hypothetical protein